MSETHPLAAEIARLNALERQIIERFIHRQRASPQSTEGAAPFGERVADRVAAFGGSWTFIFRVPFRLRRLRKPTAVRA